MIVMVEIFGVPIRGSLALLLALSVLFIVTALALGLLVSTLAKTQFAAMQFAFVVMLPSVLLSGFVFEIIGMPAPIQLITYLIPARYFLVILRGIYLKGVGLEILAGETLLLVLFSGMMVLLAMWKFRKKLV